MLFAFLIALFVCAMAYVFDFLDVLLMILACLVLIFIGLAPIVAPLLVAIGAPAALCTAIATVAALGWPVCLAMGIGLAYLIEPEFTTSLITKIGEVAVAVGEVIASTAGGVVSSFLSSPGGLIILGFGAYLLFGMLSDDDESKTITVAGPVAEGA